MLRHARAIAHLKVSPPVLRAHMSSLCMSQFSKTRHKQSFSSENDQRSKMKFMALTASAALTAYLFERQRRVDCCGIVAYLGDKDAQPVLMDGLFILQNRGYDSCGMTTVDEKGVIHTTKLASKGTTSDSVDGLSKSTPHVHLGHHIGIAHTRWATHGGKTDENAHPHHDWKNRISLVHNGTIENYAILKEGLIKKGIPFKSQTDTEVIANLIGFYLSENNNDFEDAVRKAISELQGTWGLAIIHKDHQDRIIIARNGSPLLVGTSDKQVFVASEAAALARHTNQYYALKDGEIAVVTSQGASNFIASKPLQKIHSQQVETSPDPYANWTIKEIFEQPQSLARALNFGGRIRPVTNLVKLGGLDDNREKLKTIRNLVISSCGTSMFAGFYGQLIMEWLGCFNTVKCVDASEVNSNSFPREGAGLLLISQSGETLDTVRACQIADQLNVRNFSVVNVVGSLLARMTNCGVYLNAGREVAVASTKCFTSMVTVMSLIAAWFDQVQDVTKFPERRAQLMDAVHRLPVYAGMALQCHDKCKEIADRIHKARTMFILGKGFAHPVALEGALKIKEIGYIHAEGFAGGSLKHGPFALLDSNERTPVVMLIFADEHASLMRNAAEQVKARGAELIVITDDPEQVKNLVPEENILLVPSNGPLTALLGSIPLQLIAYHLAVKKGHNPDFPRGLAKTVTVS